MTEYCHRQLRRDMNGTKAFDSRFALPGSRPQYAPDRNFGVSHVKLAIELDIQGQALNGVCTTTLRAFHEGAREVVFDAERMKVKRVFGAGRPCRFHHEAGKLVVRLCEPPNTGEEVQVIVVYRVERPTLGLYFINPNGSSSTLGTQVWTQGQDEDSRYWFPCYDAPQAKAPTEMAVTVPEGFYALSNGTLLSARHDKRTRRITYHWAMRLPHSMYLVTLAVGRWVEIGDRWNGIPVTYYVEKGRETMARLALGKTPKMLGFFSEATGYKYPYEKYAQVAVSDFPFGGMENTTATTLTELVLCDERALEEHWHESLVAHELAHQWFGNLITCKDWSHAWLNESFATYCDALFTEHEHGTDSFRYQMLRNARSYIQEDKERYRRPLVTNVYKEPWDLFDSHLYGKGACVLHMLRYILGEELWWRSIRTYVADNAWECVETIDLINAIEKATGRNMRWFFDQWVFSTGHPSYRVVYDWDARAKEALVWIVQQHAINDETQLFRMPVILEFTIDGRRRKRFNEVVKEREHTFRYKLPCEPVLFRFDPGNWILKDVDETKPREMWHFQLENDADAMGRISAAQALGRIGTGWAVEALRRALHGEKFWGAQTEIAKALAETGTEGAYQGLVGGLSLQNVRGRRAVVEAMGAFRRRDTVIHLEGALAANDSYEVPAEALRSIGKSRTSAALPILKKHLTIESWNDSIRSAALDGLAAFNDESQIHAIMPYTKNTHSFVVRTSAIRAIAALGKGRRDVLEHLLSLIYDSNLRVQLTAIYELGRLGNPKALPVLRKLVDRNISRRLLRASEEAIRHIRDGIDLPMTQQRR